MRFELGSTARKDVLCRGGNGDAYEVRCPRTHDHRRTDDFARVSAIRKSKHYRNAKRDEKRLVERKGPSKEKRCKP